MTLETCSFAEARSIGMLGTSNGKYRVWYIKSHNLETDNLTTLDFERFLGKTTKNEWTIRAIFYSNCNSLMHLEEFLGRYITTYPEVPRSS